jgi:hypothetical protein
MEATTSRFPLAVPGAWQGPETPWHWWCRRCGRWTQCNDHDICRRCRRRLRAAGIGPAAA